MRKLIPLMLIVLGLASCGHWTVISMSLSNHSAMPVSDVSVDFAGRIKRIDGLAPKGSGFLMSQGGEGGICLTYRRGGKTLSYSLGYMTENMPTHYRIEIRPESISVKERSWGSAESEAGINRPLPSGKACKA